MFNRTSYDVQRLTQVYSDLYVLKQETERLRGKGSSSDTGVRSLTTLEVNTESSTRIEGESGFKTLSGTFMSPLCLYYFYVHLLFVGDHSHDKKTKEDKRDIMPTPGTHLKNTPDRIVAPKSLNEKRIILSVS